ncbi:hypothetical protein DIPPA_04531 [Diplonema papillatum]|nr:hypothetical protein DIPPA_04531 [Diplonema papillatum]
MGCCTSSDPGLNSKRPARTDGSLSPRRTGPAEKPAAHGKVVLSSPRGSAENEGSSAGAESEAPAPDTPPGKCPATPPAFHSDFVHDFTSDSCSELMPHDRQNSCSTVQQSVGKSYRTLTADRPSVAPSPRSRFGNSFGSKACGMQRMPTGETAGPLLLQALPSFDGTMVPDRSCSPMTALSSAVGLNFTMTNCESPRGKLARSRRSAHGLTKSHRTTRLYALEGVPAACAEDTLRRELDRHGWGTNLEVFRQLAPVAANGKGPKVSPVGEETWLLKTETAQAPCWVMDVGGEAVTVEKRKRITTMLVQSPSGKWIERDEESDEAADEGGENDTDDEPYADNPAGNPSHCSSPPHPPSSPGSHPGAKPPGALPPPDIAHPAPAATRETHPNHEGSTSSGEPAIQDILSPLASPTPTTPPLDPDGSPLRRESLLQEVVAYQEQLDTRAFSEKRPLLPDPKTLAIRAQKAIPKKAKLRPSMVWIMDDMGFPVPQHIREQEEERRRAAEEAARRQHEELEIQQQEQPVEQLQEQPAQTEHLQLEQEDLPQPRPGLEQQEQQEQQDLPQPQPGLEQQEQQQQPQPPRDHGEPKEAREAPPQQPQKPRAQRPVERIKRRPDPASPQRRGSEPSTQQRRGSEPSAQHRRGSESSTQQQRRGSEPGTQQRRGSESTTQQQRRGSEASALQRRSSEPSIQQRRGSEHGVQPLLRHGSPRKGEESPKAPGRCRPASPKRLKRLGPAG